MGKEFSTRVETSTQSNKPQNEMPAESKTMQNNPSNPNLSPKSLETASFLLECPEAQEFGSQPRSVEESESSKTVVSIDLRPNTTETSPRRSPNSPNQRKVKVLSKVEIISATDSIGTEIELLKDRISREKKKEYEEAVDQLTMKVKKTRKKIKKINREC